MCIILYAHIISLLRPPATQPTQSDTMNESGAVDYSRVYTAVGSVAATVVVLSVLTVVCIFCALSKYRRQPREMIISTPKLYRGSVCRTIIAVYHV